MLAMPMSATCTGSTADSCVCFLQAELATDMNAGLSSAERRQLGELQPQIEALEQELKQAKKAASQVRLLIYKQL